MLTNDEYRALARGWNLPADGQAYVDLARTGDPSRLVSSRTTRNTPIRFASRRMGQVIQAESATVEGAFVRECEYDRERILEFYDQPPSVPLVITNRLGRRQRIPYTSDYLTLRRDGPGVTECKSPEDIAQLLQQRPDDWIRVEDGVRYQPAFEYFAAMGLVHSVWVPDERSVLRSSNIDLLLATRHSTVPTNATTLRTRLCTYFAATPVASMREVVEALSLPNAAMILRGIEEGWLYAPLDQFLLSRPDDALVALDSERFETGSQALAMWRTSCEGDTTSAVPNATRAIQMLERHQMLLGERAPTKASRTLRGYRASLKAANGNVRALIPKVRLGNRDSRISEDHEKTLYESMAEHHADSTAVPPAESYRQYKLDFEQKRADGVFKEGEFALSLPAYRARLKKLDPEQLARARGGTRAANAAAEPVDRDRCTLPACRSFEIAHADHYLGDRKLRLRLSGGRAWARKPWVSVLRDGTDEVLAMSVRFRSPSRVALAELLRDCVRRHGRLPQTIVSDLGSDFESVFYEATLASYGVHKQDRPSSAPRFGGELERLFGTIKTCVLWRGRGSTRNDARGRSVSPSHRSDRLAEQDLIDFYHELDHAIFGQLNLHLRGERLNSPDIVAANSLEMYPMSGVEVAYDYDFMVATSIDAPAKTYRVDRARGIEPLSRWYWHPQLARFDGRRVEVRIDPWDEHLVYANLDGTWVSCRARGPSRHERRDLVAMMARTTLHLDGRTEQAEAQEEADLALARSHRERDRAAVAPPAEPEPTPIGPADAHYDVDDLPSFDISWSE